MEYVKILMKASKLRSFAVWSLGVFLKEKKNWGLGWVDA